LVIALILSIGVAANVLMFSGLDTWVLKPLPFPEDDRLVAVYETLPKRGQFHELTSVPNYDDWQQLQSSFTRMGTLSRQDFALQETDTAHRVPGANITAQLFPLLGIDPILGRHFEQQECEAPGSHVALISYQIWREQYGLDTGVLGQTIRLDGETFEIIGVMPEGFGFPEWAKVWTPLVLEPTKHKRDSRWLQVFARLAPGVTMSQAKAQMAEVGARLAARYPEANGERGITVISLRDCFLPPVVRTGLINSMGAALFVLLIIVANITNLMLAQASARERESAVRIALGAGRFQLFRQFFAESMVVALLAAVLGVMLGAWGQQWMITRIPRDPPYMFELGMNLRVLGFAVGVAVLAALLCALAPLLRSAHLDVITALRSGDAGGGGRPGATRVRSILVAVEFSLSALLIISALLLTKSHRNRLEFEPGFEADNIVTMRLTLSDACQEDRQRRAAVLGQLSERLSRLAIIEQAGITDRVPISAYGYAKFSIAPGDQVIDIGEQLWTTRNRVDSSYLETIGLPLKQGRWFTSTEEDQGLPVILLSQSLAEQLWPGRDPLGRWVRISGRAPDEQLQVVGIVGNIDPGYELTDMGARPRNQMYVPYNLPRTLGVIALAVKSPAPLSSVVSAVRQELHTLDPSAVVFDVRTMHRAIEEVHWVSRIFSELFLMYGLLALAIAAVGAYGVTVNALAQRAREFAIRSALGAPPRIIARLMLTHGVVPAATGVLFGLIGALALSQLLSSLLYGVRAQDPMIFTGVGVILLLIAGITSVLPTLRAARIQPMTLLRFE